MFKLGVEAAVCTSENEELIAKYFVLNFVRLIFTFRQDNDMALTFIPKNEKFFTLDKAAIKTTKSLALNFKCFNSKRNLCKNKNFKMFINKESHEFNYHCLTLKN